MQHFCLSALTKKSHQTVLLLGFPTPKLHLILNIYLPITYPWKSHELSTSNIPDSFSSLLPLLKPLSLHHSLKPLPHLSPSDLTCSVTVAPPIWLFQLKGCPWVQNLFIICNSTSKWTYNLPTKPLSYSSVRAILPFYSCFHVSWSYYVLILIRVTYQNFLF
jgi:hypothetical protein